MRQETFIDEKPARQFGALVDAVGWDSALAVRTAREGRDMKVPTLREFTESYLSPETGHLSGVTAGTREGYAQIADRSFLRVLGELPLNVITKQDVARWVTWQESQPSTRTAGATISSKTMKNCHGVLSVVLNEAVDLKYLESNPARGTRLTRGERGNVTFLTREEFDTLLRYVPDYYRPLVLFLVGNGMVGRQRSHGRTWT